MGDANSGSRRGNYLIKGLLEHRNTEVCMRGQQLAVTTDKKQLIPEVLFPTKKQDLSVRFDIAIAFQFSKQQLEKMHDVQTLSCRPFPRHKSHSMRYLENEQDDTKTTRSHKTMTWFEFIIVACVFSRTAGGVLLSEESQYGLSQPLRTQRENQPSTSLLDFGFLLGTVIVNKLRGKQQNRSCKGFS
ncbi:hypothetical protein PAMP_013615 [Pampus punctatissimus]